MDALVRLRQARAHLLGGRAPAELPESLARLLTPQARETFDRLSAADQRHLIGVASEIADRKPGDDELAVAALLHDIGKGIGGRPVHFHDRVAKVLLACVAPLALDRLKRRDTPWPGARGVWILSRHAQTGASLVREWGYSGRVARLVERHEIADPDDGDLSLLVSLDNQSPGKAPAR